MNNPKPKPIKGSPRPKLVKSLQVKASPTKPKKRRAAKPDPDYWFSMCVRERANWTCESCGKHYEPWVGVKGEMANPGLHASHFIGRANYSVRFDPLNVDAHCAYCHRQFEGNPHEFKEWKIAQITQEVYDIVIEKSRNVLLGKQARKEKKAIADHFEKEYRKMQAIRAVRMGGRIVFEGYL